jgi:hypothetical protein
MNERETERRLRDWLDAQAPTLVPDGLRRAVAAVPATVPVGWPDRLAAALGLQRAAVPRLVWVLLLLVGLLLALLTGMLVVGSQPERRFPAVVPPVGQLFECPPGSTPDKPGPVDQARPPEERSATAFDRRAGRVVAVTNSDKDVETWTFDVCTNTWTQMHPNREPPSFEWARLVYDVDSDATLLVSSGGVWAYDLQANTWTEKGVATDAWLWAYDPLSGLVVAQGGPDPSVPLSTYDVETDTWTPIREANGGPETGGMSAAGWPGYGVLAYDASVDRIVAYVGRAETWLFDIRTGRWSKSGAETPAVMEVFAASPYVAYDEAAKRTVVIGDTRLAAYDAAADRWEILAEAEPGGLLARPMVFDGMLAGPMVFDPVNERLVGPADMAAVVAFDPGTREWTVLLEPSEGQPAPP